MIFLGNDYSYGAVPEVLEYLKQLNAIGFTGYGEDKLTRETRRMLLDNCGLDEGEIFFLCGGTQTNIVAIDRLLHHGEGIICTDTAHINVHEAGAIEYSGHKVIPLSPEMGKLMPERVEKYMNTFFSDPTWPHMVVPGAIYISQPTETGTLYSLGELQTLRDICNRFSLKLYIDGARLSYALGSPYNDTDLPALARLSDAFYIGGTKCGALFGEALVFPGHMSDTERKRLFGLIKRHGALLAKGWSDAAQFNALFTNGLYYEYGRRADDLAMKLRKSLNDVGIRNPWFSPTNQQFFIFPTHLLDRLSEEITYDLWGAPGNDESIIRLVTDWSTTDDIISRAVDTISRTIKK